MRQTILILTLILVVVLSAHFRMVTRANAARAAAMLDPIPAMSAEAGDVADVRSP